LLLPFVWKGSFRRQDEKLVAKFFLRVLELARELKLLQVGPSASMALGSKSMPVKPKPPVSSGPDPKAQSNLSDPDSRITRKSKNEAFAQAYNTQLAFVAHKSLEIFERCTLWQQNFAATPNYSAAFLERTV
jgi:hypothetical protein